MSQYEVISLTYSSPLRVNVRISSYFVQAQVQLALERVHRVCSCNVFRQIIPLGRHFIEKKARSLMLAHERAEMDVYGMFYFALVLVFFFYRTSFPSLDHAESCKSEWSCLFLVLFSDPSNQIFRVFLRKAGGVILT